MTASASGLSPPQPPARNLPAYAELHCLTNFSFLRGASHPHELVERAMLHGYSALAITDECSLAGVVRAYVARDLASIPGTMMSAAAHCRCSEPSRPRLRNPEVTTTLDP